MYGFSAAQRIQNENAIRAAMDRLLRGEIPPGGSGSCDITTLAREASASTAPPSTATGPTRAHLRTEFEHRLEQLRHAGQAPDPKTAQIERLKAEVDKLRTALVQASSTIEQLTDFRQLKPWPGSPPNTTRSSGSDIPTTRTRTLPASRRPEERSSAHADATPISDVSHSNSILIATPSTTSVANSAPGIVPFKRNTNPTAHGHCGNKPVVCHPFDRRRLGCQVRPGPMGHDHASTTSLYTCVSSDYRVSTLRRVLDTTINTALSFGEESS